MRIQWRCVTWSQSVSLMVSSMVARGRIIHFAQPEPARGGERTNRRNKGRQGDEGEISDEVRLCDKEGQ